MKKGTLKQILLITDGCSNTGEDPVAMATRAQQKGITVNVIGVLDDKMTETPKGLDEVNQIATAGGGVSRIVYPNVLTQTVQMVTRQAMTHTIQGFLNKELQQILGEDKEITDLEPEKRGEVMEVVEEFGETCDLEVVILVDTSASMTRKLETVKEALLDLSMSLTARIGENAFSLSRFPGNGQEVENILDWSPDLSKIANIFPRLTTGGITPTGPAIRSAVYDFSRRQLPTAKRIDANYIDEA